MTPTLQIFKMSNPCKKMRIFLLVITLTTFVFFSISCNAQSCKSIPAHFNSYQEALAAVKKSKFKISEEVNTSNSTFIEAAHYYSCDGNTGYLIVKIKDYEYIYADMPIAVWKGFKSSSSFGTFYNLNIRNKYQLRVN